MTKPAKPIEQPEQNLPSAEEVLRRLLNSPPEPFTQPKPEKEKKPAKQ